MKKIQISFAGNANLETVEEQLIKLSKMEDVEFYCCFLNRKMVTEKGFNTNIVDLLDRTIGDKITWLADQFPNFNEFMGNLDGARTEVAKIIDHIYVLDSATAKGVSREIELFTMGKVVLM
jgi:hypothetical protein